LRVDPAKGAEPLAQAADVMLILFADRKDVAIARGENAGKTIAYANVVRAMVPLAKWDGRAQSYRLPSGELAADAAYCAAIVQMPNHGAILGAAKAALTNGGW
jgi:hypothetical protein